MRQLNIDTALEIWNSDVGYRTINSWLANSQEYRYAQTTSDTLTYGDNEYSVQNIIDTIVSSMKPGARDITYYRGGSRRTQQSQIKNNFISVTKDRETAEAFVDGDCCLYTIVVNANVKRINTGIENEVLLEPGLLWIYKGDNKARISVPTPEEIEFYENQKKEIERQKAIVESAPQLNLQDVYADLKEENELLDIDDPITASELVQHALQLSNNRLVITEDEAEQFLQRQTTQGGGRKRRNTSKRRSIRKSRKQKRKRRTRTRAKKGLRRKSSALRRTRKTNARR